MKESEITYHFNSISQLMKHAGHPPPLHPLVALIDYGKTPFEVLKKGEKIILDFYKVSFKKSFKGRVRYGQRYYDFDEGGLAFLKPNQVVFTPDDGSNYEGYAFYFHPDFIRHYPLGRAINRYGFFSYAVDEALFLSAKEKEIISHLFYAIQSELDTNIDAFSQDVLVSQIEVLLNYSLRFYNRQFLTRKTVNHDIISSLDNVLTQYFEKSQGQQTGLPSVQYISLQLNVSARYLSDMLRSLTGQTTQQYIQQAVIERSKDLLSTSSLSIAEIAYQLGFEHPQSFSKLFKSKTNLSPLAFRATFN
ncbi:helix-turn-helix domain-containing protein [Spirosoma radiotolerans]|uniref:AraC family transcriptional regulator n=1 Tax=Spirosoma radiotolerans TaxID=1379870 RepID=A0A0E3V5I5_9BACT|nr:helix-turn-helix domain-containing protein [Spirosoma radiotolerans]AKD53686.1 AraC family transcriptional regulator [Spirosoma radiotolerans]